MNEMDATTVAHVLEKDFATTAIRLIISRLEQHDAVYGLKKFILRKSGRR
jgi:hypothetical protein